MKIYSFRDVQVTIGGVPVQGFWEGDDTVMVEPRSDAATPVVGTDGEAIVSVTADESVTITLKLQPTSPTHRYLMTKDKAQQNGSNATFPVSVRDVRNGEGGSCAECAIIQRPNVQFGAQAQSRDWVIFASRWETNAVEIV